VLAACGIDGRRRGETLNLEEFASLSRALHTALKQ
jgi:16S rRNA A1518/A1519 N6-dimethyltransferase RsmA/KsgA/DIM1 with predicted DNA glycosylase/AP lyase activity